MTTQPAANGYKVYRTENRQDDEGEFIIRLTPDALRRLPAHCWYVIVRTQERLLNRDDDTPVEPMVIAAVRPLSRDDKFGKELAVRYCQLDMGLRVAVGVKGYNPKTDAALTDVTGSAEEVYWEPYVRNIRPNVFAAWVGHQWILCRVQRALTGDFETPICRIGAPYLASLGIPDGGVVVLEAPGGSAKRRLLAADSEQQAALPPDFEHQLGVERLKLPSLYMDKSTREQLGLAPGHAVWVRRDHWATFRGKLLQLASAFALAAVGIVLALRDFVNSYWDAEKAATWLGDCVLLVSSVAIVAVLAWCAVFECRDQVRVRLADDLHSS